jgi:hypothetical protein
MEYPTPHRIQSAHEITAMPEGREFLEATANRIKSLVRIRRQETQDLSVLSQKDRKDLEDIFFQILLWISDIQWNIIDDRLAQEPPVYCHVRSLLRFIETTLSQREFSH